MLVARILWDGAPFIMIRLFFDTETTGLPRRFGAKAEDLDAWSTARLVQLSWVLDRDGDLMSVGDLIVKPDGFLIPEEAQAVHGISTEKALTEGVECKKAVYYFLGAARLAEEWVGHNIEFDLGVVGAELIRYWGKNYLFGMGGIRDTMKESVDFCQIEKKGGYGGYKWPKLMELYVKLFGKEFEGAHDSMYDIKATRECFYELKKRGVIK